VSAGWAVAIAVPQKNTGGLPMSIAEQFPAGMRDWPGHYL